MQQLFCLASQYTDAKEQRFWEITALMRKIALTIVSEAFNGSVAYKLAMTLVVVTFSRANPWHQELQHLLHSVTN